ncbi:LamG domain-containing protein [Micromonospora sp. NPDC005324]|uniref:LamG domain-containing protein n=1 Tax=Micromonospora sp. NPDC005324 TaxID=3157033 RepID=UPI0033B2EEC5
MVVLSGLSAQPASAAAPAGREPQTAAITAPPPGAVASAEARRTGKAVPVPTESAPGRSVVANPDGTFSASFSVLQQPGYPASYSRVGWSLVFEGKPDQNGWNGGIDTDGVAKVGECYPSAACNGIGTARSYFRYDTSFLNGRQVTRAKLMAREVYAPSCSPRPVNLFATADFGPGDTYRTMEARRGGWIYMDQRNVAHGYSGCGASDVEFDALTRFTKPGLENRSLTAFVLAAADENDGMAWKKFRTDPSLNVTYNSPPDRPDYLGAEGAPCTTTGESWVNPNRDVSTPARGPILSAKAWDVDAGSQTQVEFQWKQRSEPDSAIKTAYTLFQGGWSLATLTAALPSAGTETGKKLHYRARSYDGGAWSALTSWCNVSIDRTMPVPPQAVEPVEATNPAKAGLPKMFRFTSRPPERGEAPTRGFLWGTHVQGRSFVEIKADGSALVPVTVAAGGPATLYVRTVDAAGNESDQISLNYHVEAGNPARGYWPLDGLAETQARDYGTGGNHLPVDPAKVNFRAGRHGDGLRFAYAPSAVQTQRQVLDPTKPFTVAAWASLEQTGGYPTIVSQDGGVTSAFQLMATPDNRWSFAMFDSNTAGGGLPTRAVSPTALKLNTWTHLTGVWDPEAKEVRLYVNGMLSDTKSRATNSPSAAGPLAIGRSRWDSAPRDFWKGTVDEVYAFDRELPPNEIADLATGPATEELFLPLEEAQRTADPAVDMSGWYRRVAASNVTFDSTVRPLGDASGSAKFTGSTGSGFSTPSVVRTDNSFTVTARARVDEGAAGVRTVMSQNGVNNHGFALKHDAARGWVFSMYRTDDPGATPVEVVAPTTTGWTYLAGVYNAATNSISLYVGAQMKATPAVGLQPWHAAGALTIGRGTRAGAPVEPWVGWIADVHVWSGVRSSNQIVSEAIRAYTVRDRAAENPLSGQLSRYWSYDGYHVVTTGAVPPTATFEGPLGQLAPESTTEPTTELYSCRTHSRDYFLTQDPNCTEGGVTAQFLGRLGKLFSAAQASQPTTPIYRCRLEGLGHFVSRQQDCEGKPGAVNEALLGYALNYGNLVGARRAGVGDRASAAAGLPTDFHAQQQWGYVPMQHVDGLLPTQLCARTKNGAEDLYLSTAADCERSADATARVVMMAGGVFPEDFPTVTPDMTMLWRCEATSGDRFESTDFACGDVGTVGDAVPLGWISTFVR